MALFKDQSISCMAEWLAYDTKLSILSAQEATSIEAKSQLAQREIETQITGFLLRHSGAGESAARHLLAKVAITEALQRWHSMLTLNLFYADLAALQNSALHREQSRYYEARAHYAKDQLFDTGVGIVNLPIPKPQIPAIASIPGTNLPRVLRARIRYTGDNGAVGSPSGEFILDMSSGHELTVTVAAIPDYGRAWLLYLGENSDSLVLASNTPVPAAQPFAITAALPLTTTFLDPSAQVPDRFIRYSQDLWR